MKKQLKKLLSIITGITSVGIVSMLIVSAGDYMGLLQYEDILGWIELKKETALSVGLSGTTLMSGIYLAFKLFLSLKESNMDMKSELREVENNFLDRTSTLESKNDTTNKILNVISEQLIMNLKYNLIIGEKNLNNPTIDEQGKEEIKKWMEDVKNSSYQISKLLVDLTNDNSIDRNDINTFVNTTSDIIGTVDDIFDTLKGDE